MYDCVDVIVFVYIYVCVYVFHFVLVCVWHIFMWMYICMTMCMRRMFIILFPRMYRFVSVCTREFYVNVLLM